MLCSRGFHLSSCLENSSWSASLEFSIADATSSLPQSFHQLSSCMQSKFLDIKYRNNQTKKPSISLNEGFYRLMKQLAIKFCLISTIYACLGWITFCILSNWPHSIGLLASVVYCSCCCRCGYHWTLKKQQKSNVLLFENYHTK